jgi:hypothetical protein
MWLAVRNGAHLSDGWAQKLAHSSSRFHFSGLINVTSERNHCPCVETCMNGRIAIAGGGFGGMRDRTSKVPVKST